MMSGFTQIKAKKDYAVVFFTEARSYSEVASNWLFRDDSCKEKDIVLCRWPGSQVKNITGKIKSRITPPEDWSMYTVRVLRYCDTLESARKAAEDSQYSSAPETCGRGHRRRKVVSSVREPLSVYKKKDPIYSSSSDEDDAKIGTVPTLPKFIKHKSSNNISNLNGKDCGSSDSESETRDSGDTELLDADNAKSPFREREILANPESNKGKSKVSTLGRNGVDESTNAQLNRKLEALDDKIDSCVHLLGKLVTEVRDLKQRCASNNSGNSGVESAISAEVETHLKLNTRDEVTDFEERLDSCAEFKNEFKRKVKQVGGTNGKEFTERALAFIFSNKFAKENTWEGKMTKYKVKTLKVIEICEKLVLEKFPDWDKAEFSKAGTNWFRLGNQRAGEQPKQVTKKNTQACAVHQDENNA